MHYVSFIKRKHVFNRIKSLSIDKKILIDIFFKQILDNESNSMSIEKSQLLNKYKLSEAQISVLVQNGLLAIKVAL